MSRLLRLDGGVLPVSAPGADKAPKWNQLFIPGSFHRADFAGGVINMDAAFFAALVENWRRESARPLPIDYFHRGETGDDLPLEEKIAAGWIQDVQARPDGVWVLILWTDRARGYIEADELRYLSPTFTVDGLDRTTGQSQGPTLFGAALLNDPYLKELPRVAASASPPAPTPNKEQNKMDPTQQLAAMFAALGFPPDMKHEDAVAKCTSMASHCAAVPPVEVEVETPIDPKAAPLAADPAVADAMVGMARNDRALELANKEVVKLSERLQKLEAEKHAADVTRLSERLVSERRITPAQRSDVAEYAQAVGLSKADAFYSKLPAQQIGEVGTTGPSEPGGVAESTKAYWAEVDSTQKTHGLSFRDATARVNASNPTLAKSITTLNKKSA